MNGNAGAMSGLSRKRVLVLNWRDIRHPQAGGAETYMHEISRRWVQSDVDVTWFTGRGAGQSAEGEIDGVKIVRMGGPLSLYPKAALRMVSASGEFDAIVDCQNGIPFFSPLFSRKDIPVVQLVHHVHQDQFGTRFAAPMAAVGRFLEGSAARWVYGVSGHEKLPMDGHESARWRPVELPIRGHEICPLPY